MTNYPTPWRVGAEVILTHHGLIRFPVSLARQRQSPCIDDAAKPAEGRRYRDRLEIDSSPGNHVAVVLDAAGLSSAQMQAVAAEFNYSETTFVLPPRIPPPTAEVRSFTPRTEVPSQAPNVGTALILAQQAIARSEIVPDVLVFEEAGGLSSQ
jgi:hypothetical protein